MRNFAIGVLLLHLFQVAAVARLPKTVPLMPPRETGGGIGALKTKNNNFKEIHSDNLNLGFEIGTLMRNDSTSADILGMQLFFGGRATVEFPIPSTSLHLKPSLGYFRKQQSEAAVSVVQHVVEGGVNLLYEVAARKNIQWAIGVAGRVDYLISTISLYNQSNSGSSFRFRAGPSSGIKFQLANNLKLTTDLECTFSISRPTRFFGGLATGLAFDL